MTPAGWPGPATAGADAAKVEAAEVEAAAEVAVEAAAEEYLAEVDRQLPGNRRTRRDVLAELRDGLVESLAQQPAAGRAATAAWLRREFGDPAAIGAALASELRLRLARRHAVGVLLALLVAGAGWQTYYAAAGVSESVVPAGGARPVFLASIEALKVSAGVAMIAVMLLVIALSVRLPQLAAGRLPYALAGLSLAATAAFVAAMVVGVAVAEPAHRLATVALAAPFLVLMLLSAHSAFRTTRHLRYAR